MPASARPIIGGVDTHVATHHAAVIDGGGRLLDHRQFPATPDGYVQLLRWLRTKGQLEAVGIEGTGAYGAGLARHLASHGVAVVEVPRPDRRLRRQHGKSDPIDAEAAARAVLAGTATVKPKLANGPIEAVRALRVARNGAIKAKTAATNSLHAMVITAPEPLRTQLRGSLRPGWCGPACGCGLTSSAWKTRSRLTSTPYARSPAELRRLAPRPASSNASSALSPTRWHRLPPGSSPWARTPPAPCW